MVLDFMRARKTVAAHPSSTKSKQIYLELGEEESEAFLWEKGKLYTR